MLEHIPICSPTCNQSSFLKEKACDCDLRSHLCVTQDKLGTLPHIQHFSQPTQSFLALWSLTNTDSPRHASWSSMPLLPTPCSSPSVTTLHILFQLHLFLHLPRASALPPLSSALSPQPCLRYPDDSHGAIIQMLVFFSCLRLPLLGLSFVSELWSTFSWLPLWSLSEILIPTHCKWDSRLFHRAHFRRWQLPLTQARNFGTLVAFFLHKPPQIGPQLQTYWNPASIMSEIKDSLSIASTSPFVLCLIQQFLFISYNSI